MGPAGIQPTVRITHFGLHSDFSRVMGYTDCGLFPRGLYSYPSKYGKLMFRGVKIVCYDQYVSGRILLV